MDENPYEPPRVSGPLSIRHSQKQILTSARRIGLAGWTFIALGLLMFWVVGTFLVEVAAARGRLLFAALGGGPLGLLGLLLVLHGLSRSRGVTTITHFGRVRVTGQRYLLLIILMLVILLAVVAAMIIWSILSG